MANIYDVGDLVRLKATFTDPNNGDIPIDPGTVAVLYKNPAGVVTKKVFGTDSEVVKDSTGVYHIDVDIDADGQWKYRWESTGVGQAAEEAEASVQLQTVKQ